MQISTFHVDRERFGLPALIVEEFFRPLPVTRVSGADWRIDGLVNIRGRTAVVFNLRACLGLPCPNPSGSSEMILMETAGGLVTEAREANLYAFEEPIVLSVDSVSQFFTVSPDEIHPPPAHISQRFLDGVVRTDKHFFTLISMKKLVDEILQISCEVGI